MKLTYEVRTSDVPMWCTECGQHLAYSFLLDAWCCPAGCRRLGTTAEALRMFGELLHPVAHR